MESIATISGCALPYGSGNGLGLDPPVFLFGASCPKQQAHYSIGIRTWYCTRPHMVPLGASCGMCLRWRQSQRCRSTRSSSVLVMLVMLIMLIMLINRSTRSSSKGTFPTPAARPETLVALPCRTASTRVRSRSSRRPAHTSKAVLLSATYCASRVF